MRAEEPLTTSTRSLRPGVDGVHRDHVAGLVLAATDRWCARRSSFAPDQALVLAGGDDGPDDAGEDHGSRARPRRPVAAATCDGLADGEDVLEVRVRPRDHVHGDELAHPARGGGPGVGRRLDRGHVAAHQRGHVARSRSSRSPRG